MKNNKIITVIFIFILIQGCNVFQKTPGREEVKKSAGEIVKTLEKINNTGKGKPVLINIGPAVLKNISTAFIILILTSFAVALVYFISERVSLRVYGKIGERQREEILEISPYDPGIPGKLALEKKFSEAVLYIYRAALSNIARLGIPYGKGMTNMMIYGCIEKQEARNAFRNIFTIAEKVLFDAHPAIEEEYLFCVREFNLLKDIRI